MLVCIEMGDDVYNMRLVVIHKNGNVGYLEDGSIVKNVTIEELPNNTPILDISEVMNTKNGINLMMCSPTIDVRLKDGEIYYSPSVSDHVLDNLLSFERRLQTIQNEMRKLGMAGPLDIISAEQYIRNWQSIGAKVGLIKDKEIQWSCLENA